jgi:hypothetical protein
MTTVAGLPEPRYDHAVVMVKFAKQIITKMAIVTSELETFLGPGTSSLTVRAGVSNTPRIILKNKLVRLSHLNNCESSFN